MNSHPSTLNRPVINVYVAGAKAPEEHVWWFPTPYRIVDQLENSDIVVFTGGADVNPVLYNHPKHPATCFSEARDKVDKDIYEQAAKLKRPMLGICRGAQFLCVMAGGSLIQDQNNSYSTHPIKTFARKTIMVRSDHHQAQFPWPLTKGTWDLLGWTENTLDKHIGWRSGNGFRDIVIGYGKSWASNPFQTTDLPEVEDVYYRNINALAVQGHPEWAHEDNPEELESLGYYRTLVLRLLNGWDTIT